MPPVHIAKIRAYENDKRRYAKRVTNALASITERAEQIGKQMASGRKPFASDGKRLAEEAIAVVEGLAMLEALAEVAHLTKED